MKRLKRTFSLIIAVTMMALCPLSAWADEVTLNFSDGTVSDDRLSITVTDAVTGISIKEEASEAYISVSDALLFSIYNYRSDITCSFTAYGEDGITISKITINYYNSEGTQSLELDGISSFSCGFCDRYGEYYPQYGECVLNNITGITVTYTTTEPSFNVTMKDNSSSKNLLKNISDITWTAGGNRSTSITPKSASQLQDGVTVTADDYQSGACNGWYVRYLDEDKSLTMSAPEGGYLTKIIMAGAYNGAGIGTLSAGTQTVDGCTITITFDPSDKVQSVTMTGVNNDSYWHEWIESATVEYYDPSYYMTITKTDESTRIIRALDITNATVNVPENYTGNIKGMKINDGTNDFEFPLNYPLTCDENKLYVHGGIIAALQNANIVFGNYTDYFKILKTSTSGAVATYNDFAEAWTAAVNGDVITLFDNASFTGNVSARNYPSLTIDLSGHTLDGQNANYGQEDNEYLEYYSLSIMGALTVKNGTLKANIDNANVGGSHQLVLNGATLEGSNLQWMENGKVVLQNAKINLCNTREYMGYFWFEDASLDTSSSISLTGISTIGGYGNVLGGLKEVAHRLVLPSDYVLVHRSDKCLTFYNRTKDEYADKLGPTATASGATELSVCTPGTDYTNVEGTFCHLCTLCFAPCSEGSIAYDSESETATAESYTLNDGDDYEAIRQNLDNEGLSANATITAAKLTYTRTLTTNWQALYVPFSIPVNTLTNYALEVAELNDTHMYDKDDDGIFEEVSVEFLRMTSGSTEANYPYLIRATEAGQKTLVLDNAVVEAATSTSIDCSTVKQMFTFTGTYEGVSGSDMYSNNYYAMGGGSLSRVSSANVDLKPQRWYMSIENRDGTPVDYFAPAMHVLVDGEWTEETGLGSNLVQQISTDIIYDLQGRQVEETSLKAGIYVKGGKKVIIK